MQGWLSGWKEIAKYINKSIRTAKKYYYKYSMPVRKVGERGPVFALASEIDIWLIEVSKGIKRKKKINRDFRKKENT